MQLLRPVDAGERVKLEALDRSLVAARQSLLGGAQLRGDAGTLAQIPATPRQNEPGTGSDQQQHLWHGSKSETRPKRPGLDRRDEIGGEAAGSEAEVEAAFGEDAALAAKP